MVKYNFDEVIERSNTASVKYDLRKLFFGSNDVIPMWVADMDFRTPDFVIDAIRQRIEHPVLGYSIRPAEYYESIINWVKRRHDWEIRKDWICFSPGIVPAINMAVMAYTKPGDKIILQPPVYFPFFSAVKNNDRIICYNPLKLIDGRLEMDFANLEKQCRSGASVIVISNPHNPGGNAWRADELFKLADICLRNNVLMISDEIHADLVNKGYKHTVLASLSKSVAQNTVTMIAPSKTFNLAGMSTASLVIPNIKLRNRFKEVIEKLHIDLGNIFGTVASTAAYSKGDEWLDQILEYIDGNIKLLDDFLKQEIPQIKMIKPEATYMAWLDCREMKMNDKDLNKFFITQAGLGLSPGAQFGMGGKGFMRINLACPRQTLEKALNQLSGAVKARVTDHLNQVETSARKTV